MKQVNLNQPKSIYTMERQRRRDGANNRCFTAMNLIQRTVAMTLILSKFRTFQRNAKKVPRSSRPKTDGASYRQQQEDAPPFFGPACTQPLFGIPSSGSVMLRIR